MKIARCFSLLCAVCALLFLSACGKGEAPAPAAADCQPFKAAIERYLEANSMGMAVSEFKTLQVEGETAKAVCRMKEAEGNYGMTVTWEFQFQKEADAWKVKGPHTAK